MFDKSAHLYDLIYGQMKDYALETTQIHDLIAQHAPDAQTVLDVACGTGEHAARLAEQYGFRVDGLDLNPDFVELAQAKHPAGHFTQASMVDFDLGQRYDAVLCMFSSIGYVSDKIELEQALRCFCRHLQPGGLVILEPWLEPSRMQGGRVYLHTVETEEIKVVRMSHTRIEDRVSILDFEYLLGTEDGIQTITEQHKMTLFTREEMKGAFRRAGLEVMYLETEILTRRGLYLGTRTA